MFPTQYDERVSLHSFPTRRSSDLSGLSGPVQNAKVRLYGSGTSATVNGPAIYTTSSSWTETGLTWNNHPAASGSALSDTGNIPAATWAEWTVTTAITGNGTFSFVLKTDNTDGISFISRENRSEERRVG